MYLKKENGVTLIALTLTVIVMLIISSTIVYNTNTHIQKQNVDHLYEDIDAISRKVDEYYLNENDLPTLCKYCSKDDLENLLQESATKNNAILYEADDGIIINPNDGDDYYIIDLEQLSGLTVNYGYGDEYNEVKNNYGDIDDESYIDNYSEDSIFIINGVSHQIYYPAGVVADGYLYYTYDLDTNDIGVDIT